jgi:hypothetical protein
LDGNDRDLLEVLSLHLPRTAKENPGKAVWVLTVLAKIRSKHLQYYRYSNPLAETNKSEMILINETESKIAH